MHGTVVHADMMFFEQLDDFGTGKDDGSVAVGGKRIHRSVVIESGIESHSRTDTDSGDLPAWCDLRGNGMPAQQSNWSGGLGVDPTVVDGVSHAININGSCRCFQIGIGAVEQLMPEAVATLQDDESLQMFFEKPHHHGA